MHLVDSLPVIKYTSLKKYTDKRPSTLVTTKSAAKAAKFYLKGVNITNIIYVNTAAYDEVITLAKKKLRAKVIYAVGGGKVTDVGRYLAHNWNLEIFCIPSILSSDSFLVSSTGLRKNGGVIYLPTKKAETVILDLELIKSASRRYNLSGCGDVLSIYTGLYDWKYANAKKKSANNEKYSKSIALIAQSILDSMLVSIDSIRKLDEAGLKTIALTLAMEVQLCNFYGNSRPEEGGEHFFAYCIENKAPPFLHGEMVSLGVLITSVLQGQNWNKIKTFLDKIGLNYKPRGATKKIVIETLLEMPKYVKIHNLPYSIYDNFDYEENKKRLEHFFKKICLN